MDKNRIVGVAKTMRGKVKKIVGKATGNREMQADGQKDVLTGKVQRAYGGAKDTVRDFWRTK